MTIKCLPNLACALLLLLLLAACRANLPVAASTPTVPSTPDPATDLVAYYPIAGNAADDSGHDNHAAIHGATFTTDRFGRPDQAIQLDGVDDFLEVAPASSLNLTFAASLSLWLYFQPQPTADFYTLLEKSDPERDGHSRYGMWLINDRAEFCIEPAANDFQRCLDSTIALTPQSWNHLVGTYDGATLRLFVNGAPAGEKSHPRSGISQSNFKLFMGTDQYQSRPVYTLGAIDEIRLYKRALSLPEIQTLFEAQP